MSHSGRLRRLASLEDVFLCSYPEPNTGCWLWRTNHAPYRRSWVLAGRPLPRYGLTGLVLRHTCDVRCCVNPDHLVLGTSKDNAGDRARRWWMLGNIHYQKGTRPKKSP